MLSSLPKDIEPRSTFNGFGGYSGAKIDYVLATPCAKTANAAIVRDQGTGTIGNDDATSFAIAASSTIEGGTVTFTVTRSGNLSGSASAAWAVSGGSANATDFVGGVLPTGTVTFAAGESSKTVTVNVVGDTVGEADETFNVTLANVTGATVTTATASATILNDDALLNIATVTASAAEGSSGSTPFGFTITRSGNTAGIASVKWAVSGGSAVAADFSGSVLPSGTVSFAAGETTKTITVNVAGDTALEADESFNVVLSAASGATLGTATASALILNDDAQLAIAAASANMAEGTGASATPFTFTVTRSGYLGAAASANWAVSGGTATAADFTGGVLPTGTVNFAAGESSKTVTVNVAADSLVESNETFNVVLSAPSAGTSLGTATATGTIVSDDTQLDIKAAVEAGLPANDDFNGENQEGVGFYQSTTYNGRRWSSARSFLTPARKRPNLAIATNARALRILFEGRRATGVEFDQSAQRASYIRENVERVDIPQGSTFQPPVD